MGARAAVLFKCIMELIVLLCVGSPADSTGGPAWSAEYGGTCGTHAGSEGTLQWSHSFSF